jgi:hypothetical protein
MMDWFQGLQPSTATLIAATVTFTGTVILVPLVTWLISYLREKRSQLLVTLTWNEAGESKYLEDKVTKLITNSQAFKDATLRDDRRWDDVSVFRYFFSAQSYMRFQLLNNSRKKLAHLTLHDDGSSNIYQVDTGEVKEVVKGQPIVLGDLQPGREIGLHLWSISRIPVWNENPKQRFKFSADELDRIKFKEPMQRFLKQRYKYRFLKYLFFCTCLLWIVGIALGILYRP